MLTVPGCKDAARPREHERAKSLLSATHATIALAQESCMLRAVSGP